MKIFENMIYGLLAIFSLVILFVVEFFNGGADKG